MTKGELAVLTLQLLGVISSEETPTAADSKTVQDAYDRWYAEWTERGLANWTKATIPDRLGEHVARVLAVRVRSQFSSAPFDAAALSLEENIAQRPLLQLVRAFKTEARTTAEYF